MGIQGVTAVPLEIEPGRCYLAAVAAMKGEVRSVHLSVELEGRMVHDEALERSDGAATAFCATREGRARVEVEMRGSSPTWGLLIWPAGGVRP